MVYDGRALRRERAFALPKFVVSADKVLTGLFAIRYLTHEHAHTYHMGMQYLTHQYIHTHTHTRTHT